MKTKILLSILALGVIVSAFTQNTLELTFTAIDSTAYEQLDSIKVMNRTQGGDTVLYYPDTVLVLDYQVGISESNIGTHGFQVFQNYPNPMVDKTTISFYVPERDKVNLIVTDILGRVLIKNEKILDQGYHSYCFTPGNGSLFLFMVQWRESNSSIKILNDQIISSSNSEIEYIGSEVSSPQLKATEDVQSLPFSLGDTLLYIGYIDTLQSGILDALEASEIYTFQFGTNIPCPGMPTVEYEGQVYNTIQILSQCWLKENMNVGMMIDGNDEMEDNGVIEKYCYNNEPDSCTKYGGLYQWWEMMQYTTQQGVQGICPPGWHLPTDEEWKVLEGAVDSQYGIGDQIWDEFGARGFNGGTSLKTTTGWSSNANGTDLFGFSGLPGGHRDDEGYFYHIGDCGRWWTSTEIYVGNAYRRALNYSYPGVGRGYYVNYNEGCGFSFRCIRDY